MMRFTIVAFAAVITAGGCSDGLGPQPPAWATAVFGSDVIVWAADDTGDFGGLGSPLVSNNTMYFAAARGFSSALVALDAESGAMRWEAPAGSVREIVDAGSEIAVVGFGARFFSRSGLLVRALGNSSHVSNAIVGDTRVVLGTGGTGTVDALDRATGGTVWSAKVNGGNDGTRVRSLAATSDRIFAVATYNRVGAAGSLFVAAIDRATGNVLWQKTVGAFDSFAKPVLAGDKVYVALTDNEIIALSQSSGADVWRWKAPGTGSSHLGALAVCDGRVVTSHPLGVAALDATSGTILWNNTSVGAGSWRSLQCVDDRIVLGPNAVVVLDEATGATLVEYPKGRVPEDFFVMGVTLHQGSLYVTTSMGTAKLRAP